MREFVIYSNTGRTAPDFNPNKLMDAGRLDIIVHSIIHALFVSNNMRSDVILHIFLYGPPDPPKYIKIESNPDIPFSKKDIGTLLKIILAKYKRKKRVKVFPGVFVEKKEFIDFIEEMLQKKRNIYLLDKKGSPISRTKIKKDPIFILGDHIGLPKRIKRFLQKYKIPSISLGEIEYFTSQCIVILNHYLDMRKGFSLIYET